MGGTVVKPLDALSAIRGLIGLGALFAPRLVTWSLGFRRPPGTELRYVMKIWGVRNVVFEVAARSAPPGPARASWLRASVAIDLLDLLVGLVFVRRARPGARTATAATLPPAVAAGLGVASYRAHVGPSAADARTSEDDPTT